MKVIVIGVGYVGLVQGVCLAELGHSIVCIDVDENKIKKLKNGFSPIYEPGIEELINKNLKAKRIIFDTNLKKYLNESEVIFIAVGTPSNNDGSANLNFIVEVAREIGKHLKSYQVIVNKSTVPIGTGQMVKNEIKKWYKGKFDVVSNPEFLKEGSALEDFMNPDRIVIGDENTGSAAKKVAKLYESLKAPIIITNLETAEMIKYASNSYLATQISFINSISHICEKVGANVKEVAEGMRLDSRIGKKAFLNAGLGYGGSCFPKDVKALVKIAQENSENFSILEEVERVNIDQRYRFISKVKSILTNVKGKKIALWGIAFKPKTDDIREAPSLTIIEDLLSSGAELIAYDSVAESNVKKLYPQIKFSYSPLNTLKNVEALLIITDWDEFKGLDLKKIKQNMKSPNIFDGRNIYDPNEMRKLGLNYYSIGRKI